MNRQFSISSRLAAFIVLTAAISLGQVRLPRLISDGMVLQRDTPLTLRGWAAPGEAVSLQFRDSTFRAVSDSNGRWTMSLPAIAAGGPYEMVFIAANVVRVNDIMFGDVWVASGQSNMELTMRRASPLYPEVIASAENRSIRQFEVPDEYDFAGPRDDYSGGKWKYADPTSVLDFSAVAYFFARDLNDRYRVPVGIINASLGGSPAEAWMSEEALRPFPSLLEEGLHYRNPEVIRQIERDDRERIEGWYATLQQRDAGCQPGKRAWFDPAIKIGSWKKMRIPGSWADGPLGPVNGVVWFRREVTVPSAMAGLPARLELGRIVDADSVFLNGVFVGTTSYQYPPRRYTVRAGILKGGRNVVVVRVISNAGKGGFVPDKVYALHVADTTIDLQGVWRYRLGAAMPPLAGQTFIRWKPMGLHHAMLAPLFGTQIRGVIWYQGESNADRPAEYRRLFPALIRDWRQHWVQGELPFIFVQLPNFMEPAQTPAESNWALMREAQALALAEPKTGMAVAIDVGEWNDIHPLNKRDVGHRLALAARKIAYGESLLVASGPAYSGMTIDSGRAVISFTDTGTGLAARGGGPLRGFAIAGADRRFVWADARIEGSTIVVWSNAVPEPVAVRYAWASNPSQANLNNVEGLPALPFRTDDWLAR